MSTKTPEQIKGLLDNLRPCKKIIAGALKGKEFKTVLEVGCQWGECLKAIQEEFPDKELTGLDKDGTDLDKSKQFLSGINLIQGDANQLPFKNDSFDVVFTSALFCMLPPWDVENCLNEIIRVAKKHILLIELDDKPSISMIDKDRVGCNWELLFKERGFEITKRKIGAEEWDAMPWKYYGYLVKAMKHE